MKIRKRKKGRKRKKMVSEKKISSLTLFTLLPGDAEIFLSNSLLIHPYAGWVSYQVTVRPLVLFCFVLFFPKLWRCFWVFMSLLEVHGHSFIQQGSIPPVTPDKELALIKGTIVRSPLVQTHLSEQKIPGWAGYHQVWWAQGHPTIPQSAILHVWTEQNPIEKSMLRTILLNVWCGTEASKSPDLSPSPTLY